MYIISASDKIYIAESAIENAGRGVFARIDIKKGELIETCPVIAIDEHDTSNLQETILVTYFYYFGKKKERSVVALGFGSIYNHSDQPNAMYMEKQNEQVIEFFALREIKQNEEITVHYNQGKQNDN